jgi:hypothetical protein
MDAHQEGEDHASSSSSDASSEDESGESEEFFETS